MAELSEAFAALPLESVRDAVLERARERGCEHADVRVERIADQYVSLRDARLVGSIDNVELGTGVRVVIDGSLGFAATIDTSPSAAADLVDQAIDAARATAAARLHRVELAGEDIYNDVTWVAPFERDPTSVPLAERVARLEAWSVELLSSDVVDHVSASLHGVSEEKFYADLAGTSTRQRRVRVHPAIEALALERDGDGFETMRTLAAPVGRGYEYLDGVAWDADGEIAALPELLSEKLSAPSVEPGRYDVVIDPSNLWLTIHESVGHATELDRALGYEAAYAGTSFVTTDKLGSLAYGSSLMNVRGDRTTPYGLASIGYDDDGVAAQSFDIVSNGTFVGYQLDRQFAALFGAPRSNGCAFAASPFLSPMQRMANVSLAPGPAEGPSIDELISGVDRGIYIVGDKSWSIDMQRYNFQFTGQRFYRIEHGRLTGQLRDVAYQATTTEFWGSLVGLGGRSTYVLGGAMNCGKGQPGQTAPVSHGCPAALFRDVAILNTRAESGR